MCRGTAPDSPKSESQPLNLWYCMHNTKKSLMYSQQNTTIGKPGSQGGRNPVRAGADTVFEADGEL